MRRDHDVVELEVGRAAVVEVGHREAVDVVDLIGHRAVQHRDAPLVPMRRSALSAAGERRSGSIPPAARTTLPPAASIVAASSTA